MEITLQQFEAMCQNRQLHNGYVEGLGCVFWRSRYVISSDTTSTESFSTPFYELVVIKDEKNIESVIRKLVLLDLLEQQQEEEDTDKVNLLTLHAAKGLEFPYVYMIGLEEELLPHKNSIAAETIEEERRLMYVGITRARQGLTLTLAEQRKNGGQMRQMTPSRFLDELPQDELEWLGRKKKLVSNVDPKEQAQQHLANLRALLKR